jgi:hypothetical protein
MRITRYPLDTQDAAVDFRADPDGEWDYDTLLEAAGFSKDAATVRVGALSSSFRDHAEGAAVVSELDGEIMAGRYFAIVELDVATPLLFARAAHAVAPQPVHAALACVLPVSLSRDSLQDPLSQNREATSSRAA